MWGVSNRDGESDTKHSMGDSDPKTRETHPPSSSHNPRQLGKPAFRSHVSSGNWYLMFTPMACSVSVHEKARIKAIPG